MFIPWVMERVLDAVEASGKKRTGHAAAMYLNKKYGSQLMSQHTLNYMRGKTVPRGGQAVELIEAAGLDPLTYLPFAELESVFADKRSSVRHKYYWIFIAGYWAHSLKVETPWLGEGGTYLDYVVHHQLEGWHDPMLVEEGISIPPAVGKWLESSGWLRPLENE